MGGLTLTGLSLAACASAAPPTVAGSEPPASAQVAEPQPPATVPSAAVSSAPVAPGPAPLDLANEMAARSVTSERLAFGILYSWTTDAQLDELAKGGAFLSRSVSKKHGISAFDDLVAADFNARPRCREDPLARRVCEETIRVAEPVCGAPR